MDRNRFSQFEERLQTLIEGGFARLFAGRLQPREVALRLARAMEDGADLDHAGNLAAPNHYVVHLNPEDHAALLAAQPDIAVSLADHIVSLARQSELWLDTPPEVVLAPDPAIALHGIQVNAAHADLARQTTQMLLVDDETPPLPEEPPELPPAFLIVNGSRYVPLDRTVINIGRRRDNAIVLDDRRVSRQHCQLRLRFGQWVLYDLASRGGTFVNEARVSECVLRSNDVISLGGVKIVYVVEEGSSEKRPPAGDTQISKKRDHTGSDHE